MKKLLMLLTGILGLTVGTVANIFNASETTEKTILNTPQGRYWIESEDIVKYDVAESGNMIGVELPDLLTLFNELNKIHKENHTKIELYGIPEFFLIGDDDNFLAYGKAKESSDNINSLINSDYIKFTGVSMALSVTNNSSFTVRLSYEISDIEQQLILFKYQGAGLPSKQEAAKLIYHATYEY